MIPISLSFSHRIFPLTVEFKCCYKDDGWINLKSPSKDGRFFYSRSGLEEPKGSKAWDGSNPVTGKDCIYMDLEDGHVRGSFYSTKCSYVWDFTLCEIPYVD